MSKQGLGGNAFGRSCSLGTLIKCARGALARDEQTRPIDRGDAGLRRADRYVSTWRLTQFCRCPRYLFIVQTAFESSVCP